MFGAPDKSQCRDGVFGTCFNTFCSRVALQPGCVACLRVSFGGNCLRLRIAPPTRSELALPHRLTRSRSCFPDADMPRTRQSCAPSRARIRLKCPRPTASASVLPTARCQRLGAANGQLPTPQYCQRRFLLASTFHAWMVRSRGRAKTRPLWNTWYKSAALNREPRS